MNTDIIIGLGAVVLVYRILLWYAYKDMDTSDRDFFNHEP